MPPSCHPILHLVILSEAKDLVNTPKRNFIRELHRNRLTHSESEADENHFQLFIQKHDEMGDLCKLRNK